LQFRGAHRGVGHVVDQPDMDSHAVVAIAQQELLDPAHGVTAALEQKCIMSSRMKIQKVQRDAI
jgi:hypothetical protein